MYLAPGNFWSHFLEKIGGAAGPPVLLIAECFESAGQLVLHLHVEGGPLGFLETDESFLLHVMPCKNDNTGRSYSYMWLFTEQEHAHEISLWAMTLKPIDRAKVFARDGRYIISQSWVRHQAIISNIQTQKLRHGKSAS